MSTFKKYLEIIQEKTFTNAEFEKVKKEQKEDMDYITFILSTGEDKIYVCDKDGKYCDPKTTKISDIKDMIEKELKIKLTYSEKFLSMKNNQNATALAVSDKAVDPFEEGFLTVVSQKKSRKM